jgi:hypothetical protein
VVHPPEVAFVRHSILALLAGAAVLAGSQPPRRVPVIAGNGLVHVLVEIDGTVKTWGDPVRLDMSPSLGDGKRPGPEGTEPRLLAGVTGVVDAAVGPTQVLLLRSDGTVLAWGDNDACEVSGDGKTKLAPVPVAGLRHVVQIGAGYAFSAALLEDGTVWQWGSGAGTPCPSPPAKIEGLTGVTQIAIGDASLALKSDGTVWGWGDNRKGELCDVTAGKLLRPVQIAGLAGVTRLDMGDVAVFLLADGTVRMCGSNENGALAASAGTKASHVPLKVPGVSGVTMVRSAHGTTIVQLADGTLRAWGLGWYGALGDGHGDQFSPQPRAPIGVGPVIAYYMETNGSATFAVRADGTVMWWGVLAPPGGKTQFVLTPVPAPFKVKM